MANLREIQARRKKKPSLAELRARKQEQKTSNGGGLAALRQRKQKQKSNTRDFSVFGVRYHNPQQINGYWTVDVTNGDKTFTLHNKHGCWMHSVSKREGHMKEPVVVARMLGTNMGQVEMVQNLIERMTREQRALGIPTREQMLHQREVEEREQRRKNRKKEDSE